MHTTAHPDDENNGLLVMLNRGQGYRTALATATRGNGGQNEIGPEIFEALGVLRTGELAALHRFDGAEQYFTRAVDFGYSFSIDETFEKWGREEITADYVRLIRTIRPDVIITLPPTGTAGGQHHMASAVITRDAYKLAADPTKFPEQIKEGLRPWQPKKLYHLAAFGFPGEPAPQGKVTRINTGVYDALLGKTYTEIGTEARSMHKCQGMAQLLALPAPTLSSALPARRNHAAGADAEGRDVALRRHRHQHRSLATIRRPASAADAHRRAEGDLGRRLQRPENLRHGQRPSDAEADPRRPLRRPRAARASCSTLQIDEAARYEIDFRLRQKEGEFQQAAHACQRREDRSAGRRWGRRAWASR